MESLEEDIIEMKKDISYIKEMLSSRKLENVEVEEDIPLQSIDEGVCADLFKALSNEERLKILKALFKGDLYFAQLKEHTKMDHSPLRFHLTVLKDVNLIGQERFRGKYSITTLGNETLRIALSFNKLVTKECV